MSDQDQIHRYSDSPKFNAPLRNAACGSKATGSMSLVCLLVTSVGGWCLKVPLVLPRCLPEPASARVIEGALFRVAEQARDLAEMQPGFGEVSRRQGPPFPFDQVLTSHALGGQPSLQRPWMHRELVRDGINAALAGGQQPAGQLCHAVGQRRGARKIVGLKVFRRNASGLRIRALDASVGQAVG